jgi:hypothetical protein
MIRELLWVSTAFEFPPPATRLRHIQPDLQEVEKAFFLAWKLITTDRDFKVSYLNFIDATL